MEILELKNATFYPDKIVLYKKNGNIIINVIDIFSVNYEKPNLFNFLLMFMGGAFLVGALALNLNKRINGKRYYIVRIKFKDVCKLPHFYLKKIDPTNRWGLY